MALYSKELIEEKGLSRGIDFILKEMRAFSNTGKDSDEFIKLYIDKISSDYLQEVDYIRHMSGFDPSFIAPVYPFRYFLEPKLKLDASISLNINKDTFTEISVSIGLPLAISDIMHRVCCNKDFLSYPYNSKNRLWEGTDCYWPQSKWVPSKRFINYNPVENTGFNYPYSSQVGLFYSGIPHGDKDRMYLSKLMGFIANCWTLFHEECHYWHGHLHFANSNRLANLYRLSETEIDIENNHLLLFKTFEWQADRNATLDLISFFFTKGNYNFELPDLYKKEEPLLWRLRIMFMSIGMLILIFRKSDIINKKKSFYPSPQTRLICFFTIALSRLINMNKSGHLNVTNISTDDLVNLSYKAIRSTLYELSQVQNILINDVVFDNDSLKSNFEPDNISAVDLLPVDINKVDQIAFSFLTMKSDDLHIDNLWFSEYRNLVPLHNELYNKILKQYRTSACVGGRSPLTD